MRTVIVLTAAIIALGVFAAPASRFPVAQQRQVAAVNSYQIKFSYKKNDGKRSITSTIVQAKSSTDAQRQVKASYNNVNIITIKKL